MIYLDSNGFIYAVVADEKTEEKSRLSKEILVRLSEGNIEVGTSTLTWDELVWNVKKFLGEETAKVEGKKFLEFPNLKILNVDITTITEAQRITETYKLKPRDSIHAACAIKNNISKIISDDPDFDKVKEIERISLEKANEL